MNSAQCTQLLDRLCQEPSEALESDTVEFKHYSSEGALHNAKDLAEEISALANHKGGIVLVGVRDSSNVSHGMWGAQLAGFVRVDLHTTCERLRGKLRPSLDLELSEIKHATPFNIGLQLFI